MEHMRHEPRACRAAECGANAGKTERKDDERTIAAQEGSVAWALEVSGRADTWDTSNISPGSVASTSQLAATHSASAITAPSVATQAVSGDGKETFKSALSLDGNSKGNNWRFAEGDSIKQTARTSAASVKPVAVASHAAVALEADLAIVDQAILSEADLRSSPASMAPLNTVALTALSERPAGGGDTAAVTDVQVAAPSAISARHDAAIASSRPAVHVASMPEPLVPGKSEPSRQPYVLHPNTRNLFAGVRIRVLPHAFGMALTFECSTLEQRKQIERLSGRLAAVITRRTRSQISVGAKLLCDGVEAQPEL